jgi:chromosome segregation ATPase
MITGITGSGSASPGNPGGPNNEPAAAPPPQSDVRYVEVRRAEQGGSGESKVPILMGAVVALVAASVYNIYEINQLKSQLADTREILTSEVGRVNESSTTSTKTTRASVDALKSELVEARRQAAQMVGQAKVDAAKNVDILEDKLEKATVQQAAQTAKVAESVTQVSQQVSAVKEDTNANKANVAAVSTEVAAVKTQGEATKAELQKTIADLTSAKGDLGVQSGLIATNSKQLQALKELGERNYTEFRIAKAKTSQKVGDLQIRLTKTDEKKNKYTVEVIANDKMVEKKDRTANEPVQFMLPRYTQPYEMVVNEVKKDMIVGYVSSPKVQAARN